MSKTTGFAVAGKGEYGIHSLQACFLALAFSFHILRTRALATTGPAFYMTFRKVKRFKHFLSFSDAADQRIKTMT